MACKIAEFNLTCMYPWFAIVGMVLVLAIVIRDLALVKTVSASPQHSWKAAKNQWSVTVNLTQVPTTFKTKVKYLTDVLDDVLVNYQAGSQMSYKIRIKAGVHVYDYGHHGCFSSARLVLHLIDIGLADVFKAKTIDITLLE